MRARKNRLFGFVRIAEKIEAKVEIYFQPSFSERKIKGNQIQLEIFSLLSEMKIQRELLEKILIELTELTSFFHFEFYRNISSFHRWKLLKKGNFFIKTILNFKCIMGPSQINSINSKVYSLTRFFIWMTTSYDYELKLKTTTRRSIFFWNLNIDHVPFTDLNHSSSKKEWMGEIWDFNRTKADFNDES